MTRLSAAVAVRLPVDLTLLLLRREAAVSGRPELAVSAAALRQWKRRGHLSKGAGYDPAEILAYIDKRTEKAA